MKIIFKVLRKSLVSSFPILFNPWFPAQQLTTADGETSFSSMSERDLTPALA